MKAFRPDSDGILAAEHGANETGVLYGAKWTDQLKAISDTETITTSTWTVTVKQGDDNTTPLVVSNEGSVSPTGITSFRVSGGTVGSQYDLANTVTTSSGQTFIKYARMRVVAVRGF